MSNERSALGFSLLLVASAASWGFGTVMTKHALGDVPPFTLAVVQLAASSAVLWLVVLSLGLRAPLNRQTARLALTGLLEPGLVITLAVLGLKWTTATMTTLIYAAQPALVVVLAWLLLRERLTRMQVGLTLLAVAGVGLVAGAALGADGAGTLLGNGLIVLSSLSCSLYLVYSRRWVARMHPILLVALQQSVALVWTLAVWPVEAVQLNAGALAAIGPGVWAWAALSGVVYYGLGFCFYIAGLKGVPAGRAALFLGLSPLFGVGGAYALLGERLSPAQWLGAALVVVAVAAISRGQTAEPAQPPSTPAVAFSPNP
jgi:drug/metabolite transporter (DMT)-like permease